MPAINPNSKPRREPKPTRGDFLNEWLRENRKHQVAPNVLHEDIKLPEEFAAAFMTGRTQLLRLSKPRALSEEECAALMHAFAVMLERQNALIQHAELLGQEAKSFADMFKGIHRTLDRMSNFANFVVADEVPDDEGDEA